MDLRLMQYFVAVVDHGGITRAANALFIAQPSLSQAIKSLETEIGARLFDRTGRSLELTDAGRSFEVAARRVMRDVEIAQRRVDAVRNLDAGRLQVSAVADVTLHPLPDLVHVFRARHPGVQVRITDPGHSAGVVSAVRQGHADIGLATLPVKADALTVASIGPQRMVLVTTPELGADLPDPLPQAMLGDLPLIRSVEDRLADVVDNTDVLMSASEAPIRSGIRQLTWELVMLGVGMAIMPEGIARSQLTGVELRRLEPDIQREVAVIYRSEQVSPAAAAFLSTLALRGSGAEFSAAVNSSATSTKARAAEDNESAR